MEMPRPPSAEMRPSECSEVQRLTRETVIKLEGRLANDGINQGELPEYVHTAIQEALRNPAAMQALRSFGLIANLYPEIRWRDPEGIMLFIEGKEVARSQSIWPGDIVQMLRRGLASSALNREEENAQIALNRSQIATEELSSLQSFDTLMENPQQAEAALRQVASTLGLKQPIDVLTVSRNGGAGTVLLFEKQSLAPIAYIELTPVRLIAGMNAIRPSVRASSLTLKPALSSLPQAALLRLLCARVQADPMRASVKRSSTGYVLSYKDPQGKDASKTFNE